MEKRYEHQQRSAALQELWKNNNTYAYNPKASKTYTIDTPPPTVSGSLHIGHIFSYTQTDIIARYKRMTGHSVFYPFGFDCNGLPTERFVEKKHKTNVGKIGRPAFIDLCLQTTKEAEQDFTNLWQDIGLSANFDQTYSTISPDVQKISQESFLRLAEKDFVYMQEEPAMYCPATRTTVAQAELEDVEKSTLFSDITFTTPEGEVLTIATTRPELLGACVALLYHPEDTRYTHLKNKTARVPFYNIDVPILSDDLVQKDKGTGLVMVCTFGDKNDVIWYKKHKLPYRQAIDLSGKMTALTGPLEGLKVEQARAKILDILTDHGFVGKQETITHAVSVYERSKKEIEYIVLPQWFVKVLEHKEAILQLADNITWHPKHMKSRFIDWVENLGWDWCISRQRVYGIPFPVWYEKDTGKPVFASKKQLPVNPLVDLPEDYTGDPDNLIPEKDVMDTWNTSSLSPYICKSLANNGANPFEDTNFIPMGMRPQAHDIIRTWAFYTIVKCWMHDNTIAWKDIVISGYVLAENKEKISKSKNNAPTEPTKLLQQFPADAIRYWTASGSLGHDIAFSPDQMKIGQKLITKLWNACKFAGMHIADYTPKKQKTINPDDTINQWMLHQTHACLTTVHKYFEKQEFGLALHAIEQLFWNDFCDNYIEIIKDQFFKPEQYSNQLRSDTQATLYTVTLHLLQLFAPYLPFITEEIYQSLYADKEEIASIHSTQLPQNIQQKNISSVSHMQTLLYIVHTVRKLKTQKELSLKTEITSVTLSGFSAQEQTMINEHAAILQGVCKAEKIITSDDSQQETAISNDGDMWHIHIAQERRA